MTVAPQEISEPRFDVLSYPGNAVTTGIVVDVEGVEPEGLRSRVEEAEAPHRLLLGGSAIAGSAPEAAARYRMIIEECGHDIRSTTLLCDKPELRDDVLEAGMGMVHVEDAEALDDALEIMLDPASRTEQRFYETPLYTDFSYEDVIRALCRPGTINVVGFVGRTGAGKSTTINRLLDTLHGMGGHGGKFELDSFFLKTRKERKAWLSEPCISDEERARRGNVTNWWDFDRALDTLDRIRAGEHVHLEGLYDMEQDGEKVGVMDLDPGEYGFTVFVEGTTLLMPVMCQALDSFIYLNAHDHKRAQALMARNLRDDYTPEESRERKRLTDGAETNHHISKDLRTRRFRLGRLTVLDNSDHADHLTLLPPYIPQI